MPTVKDKTGRSVAHLVQLYLERKLSPEQVKQEFVPSLLKFTGECVIDVFVQRTNPPEVFHGAAAVGIVVVGAACVTMFAVHIVR